MDARGTVGPARLPADIPLLSKAEGLDARYYLPGHRLGEETPAERN